MSASGSKCIVCGLPCKPEDRNTDGTYAHNHCLMAHQTRPGVK